MNIIIICVQVFLRPMVINVKLTRDFIYYYITEITENMAQL